MDFGIYSGPGIVFGKSKGIGGFLTVSRVGTPSLLIVQGSAV